MPDSSYVIQRQHLAKIAAKLAGLDAEVDAVIEEFAGDNKTGVWGFEQGWIQAAYNAELMLGEGGTFNATKQVTMAHLLTVVLRAAGFGDELDNDNWKASAVEVALANGFIASSVDPDAIATYGDLVNQTYNAYEELQDETGDLALVSVDAINGTQAEVVFNKAVKEAKPANFKVTDKNGDLVFISSVELNKAKDTATLTFFSKFANKAVYNVEVSNIKDADGNALATVTDSFTYLSADVVSIAFKTNKVKTGSDLRDALLVKDELGRDVTKENTITFESSKENIVDESGMALAAGSSIVVAKVGKITTGAKAITVENAKIASFAGSYIHEDDEAAATDTEAFFKLEDEDIIDYVYKSDESSKLAVYYLDQFGNEDLGVAQAFNATGKPTLENMTPGIVIVGDDGSISPMAVGTGYVKITSGSALVPPLVSTTIKIEVRADAKISSMELEETNVQIVKGLSKTVKVIFKDQYGTKMSATPTTVKSDKVATASVVKGANQVVITGVAAGTATIEVTHKVGFGPQEKTFEGTINVTVVAAGDLVSYQVEASATKIDVSGENNNPKKTPVSATVVVNKIDTKGNVIGTEDATLVELDKDGEEVVNDKVTIGGQVITAKAAGTAYVEVTVGSYVVDVLVIEVINSAPTAKVADFNANTLVVKVPEYNAEADLTVAVEINNDLLTDLVTVKDQYGKVVEGLTLEFEFTVTNLKSLEYADGEVTRLKAASGTADIVITEVSYDGAPANTNLITENVVIKLSVQADADLAVEAINDGANDDSATLGNYKAAGIKGVVADNLTAVNTAVEAARDGNDLTKAEIQEAVDAYLDGAALDAEAAKITEAAIEGDGLATGDNVLAKAGALVAAGYTVTLKSSANLAIDEVTGLVTQDAVEDKEGNVVFNVAKGDLDKDVTVSLKVPKAD